MRDKNDVCIGLRGMEIFVSYYSRLYSIGRDAEKITWSRRINGDLFDILALLGKNLATEGLREINVRNFGEGYSSLSEDEKKMLKAVNHYVGAYLDASKK